MTQPLLEVVGAELAVPVLGGGEVRAVNLDYAASSPALRVVADRLAEILPWYASVHRGSGYPSQLNTAVYEGARDVVRRFVGAVDAFEVVFTRNTTDALNLLASVVPGPVVTLDLEHHADLLPWQRSGSGSRVITAADTIDETLDRVAQDLAREPAALLAVTGAGNVTGEVLPLRRLASIAHAAGARLAVDGAQLVPHRRVAVAASGVDYLAFSGHKTYAPFGAGVLVGRGDWLDAGDPYLAGGGAVSKVTRDEVSWHRGPARHEAGSPNIIGVAALARAIEELESLDAEVWRAHEVALSDALRAGLAALPGVEVLTAFDDADDRVGVATFVVPGIDQGLLAQRLSAEHGIGVRYGRFCAHPLLDRLGVPGGALRASIGVGSRSDDVERLIAAIIEVRSTPGDGYRFEDGEWRPLDDRRPRPEWAPAWVGGRETAGCAI